MRSMTCCGWQFTPSKPRALQPTRVRLQRFSAGATNGLVMSARSLLPLLALALLGAASASSAQDLLVRNATVHTASARGSLDHVGKTESHGCVRMTNWDALQVADAVDASVPVVMQE